MKMEVIGLYTVNGIHGCYLEVVDSTEPRRYTACDNQYLPFDEMPFDELYGQIFDLDFITDYDLHERIDRIKLT